MTNSDSSTASARRPRSVVRSRRTGAKLFSFTTRIAAIAILAAMATITASTTSAQAQTVTLEPVRSSPSDSNPSNRNRDISETVNSTTHFTAQLRGFTASAFPANSSRVRLYLRVSELADGAGTSTGFTSPEDSEGITDGNECAVATGNSPPDLCGVQANQFFLGHGVLDTPFVGLNNPTGRDPDVFRLDLLNSDFPASGSRDVTFSLITRAAAAPNQRLSMNLFQVDFRNSNGSIRRGTAVHTSGDATASSRIINYTVRSSTVPVNTGSLFRVTVDDAEATLVTSATSRAIADNTGVIEVSAGTSSGTLTIVPNDPRDIIRRVNAATGDLGGLSPTGGAGNNRTIRGTRTFDITGIDADDVMRIRIRPGGDSDDSNERQYGITFMGPPAIPGMLASISLAGVSSDDLAVAGTSANYTGSGTIALDAGTGSGALVMDVTNDADTIVSIDGVSQAGDLSGTFSSRSSPGDFTIATLGDLTPGTNTLTITISPAGTSAGTGDRVYTIIVTVDPGSAAASIVAVGDTTLGVGEEGNFNVILQGFNATNLHTAQITLNFGTTAFAAVGGNARVQQNDDYTVTIPDTIDAVNIGPNDRSTNGDIFLIINDSSFTADGTAYIPFSFVARTAAPTRTITLKGRGSGALVQTFNSFGNAVERVTPSPNTLAYTVNAASSPTVTLAATTTAVEGTSPGEFTVTLANFAADAQVEIPYTVAAADFRRNINAMEGTDFDSDFGIGNTIGTTTHEDAANTFTVTVDGSGDAEFTVIVNTLSDLVVEGNENVVLSLTPFDSITPAGSPADMTITDDPTFSNRTVVRLTDPLRSAQRLTSAREETANLVVWVEHVGALATPATYQVRLISQSGGTNVAAGTTGVDVEIAAGEITVEALELDSRRNDPSMLLLTIPATVDTGEEVFRLEIVEATINYGTVRDADHYSGKIAFGALDVAIPLSNVATLTAMTVGGDSVGGLDGSTPTVTLTTEGDLEVIATAARVDASSVTWDVNSSGTATALGKAGATFTAPAVTLADGNTLNIVSTAEDTTTRATYNVVVSTGESNVSSLSALDVTNADGSNALIPLSPGFGSETTSYTANVLFPVDTITVAPTATDDGASYEITVGGDATLVSGGTNVAAVIELTENSTNNTITITVTAEDRTVSNPPYTLTVTRAAARTGSALTALDVTNVADSAAITLSPGFGSGTTYTANVASTINTIRVTPVADPGATYRIRASGDATLDSGGINAFADVTLAENSSNNIITITATSESGTDGTPYIITVTRARTLSTDATLTGIGLGGESLNTTFSEGTTSYTVAVDNSVESITVTPAVAAGATYVVAATSPASQTGGNDIPAVVTLAVGANVITIDVTAENRVNTGPQYTITVTRAAAPPTFSDPAITYTGPARNGAITLTLDYDDDILSRVTNNTPPVTDFVYVSSSGLDGTPIDCGGGSYTVGDVIPTDTLHRDCNRASDGEGFIASGAPGAEITFRLRNSVGDSAVATLTFAAETATVTSATFAAWTGETTGTEIAEIGPPLAIPVTEGATVYARLTLNTALGAGETVTATPGNPEAAGLGGNTHDATIANDGTTDLDTIISAVYSIDPTEDVDVGPVTASTDDIVEGPEYFQVDVGGSITYSHGDLNSNLTPTDGLLTYRIVDATTTDATVSLATTVTEGATDVTVTIDLDGSTILAADADFTLQLEDPDSGTPAQGVDVSFPSVITITQGASSGSTTMTITGGDGADTGESFKVGILSADYKGRDYGTAVTFVASGDVAITDTASADARLTALGVTGASLVEGFLPGTTTYTANVVNSVENITVTPTAAAGATYAVTVTGGDATLDSGGINAAAEIELAVSTNNLITITVTAEDRTATETYTLTVTRAALSPDATLTGIDLTGGGILSPVFAPGTTTYTMGVHNSVQNITVTPAAAAGASYEITVGGDATLVSGGNNIPAVIRLTENSTNNIITITVEAENGTEGDPPYTLTVTRASDARLAVNNGLTLTPANGGSAEVGVISTEVNTGDNPDSVTIAVSVPFGTTAATVRATARDNAASFGTFVNNGGLGVGGTTTDVTPTTASADITGIEDTNSFRFTVSPATGPDVRYFVTINYRDRSTSTDATLAGMTLTPTAPTAGSAEDGDIGPIIPVASAQDTAAITVEVPFGTTAATVTATANDGDASFGTFVHGGGGVMVGTTTRMNNGDGTDGIAATATAEISDIDDDDTFRFTVTPGSAIDSGGAVDTDLNVVYTVTITVLPRATPVYTGITQPDLTYVVDSRPLVPTTLPEADGGTGTVTYALTPTLPDGLTFDAGSREIRGTPTVTLSTSNTFTLTATDMSSPPVTAMLMFDITVNAAQTGGPLLRDQIAENPFVAVTNAGDGNAQTQTLDPAFTSGATAFTIDLDPANILTNSGVRGPARISYELFPATGNDYILVCNGTIRVNGGSNAIFTSNNSDDITAIRTLPAPGQSHNITVYVTAASRTPGTVNLSSGNAGACAAADADFVRASQTDTTKYTFAINRDPAAANDSGLDSLSVAGVSVTDLLPADTTTDTTGSGSVTIGDDATEAEIVATAKGGTVTTISGGTSGSVTTGNSRVTTTTLEGLEVGPNEVTIIVRSLDGSATRTYNILVIVPAAGPQLSALTLGISSRGVVSENLQTLMYEPGSGTEFNSGVYEYTSVLSDDIITSTSGVTYQIHAVDSAHYLLICRGTTAVTGGIGNAPIPAGAASEIPFPGQSFDVNIYVVNNSQSRPLTTTAGCADTDTDAENTATTTKYTVTVSRANAGNDNAELQVLEVAGAGVSGFVAGGAPVAPYDVVLPFGADAGAINARAGNTGARIEATISGNGVTRTGGNDGGNEHCIGTDGNIDGCGVASVDPGDTAVLTIVVTPANGNASLNETYIVNITSAPAPTVTISTSGSRAIPDDGSRTFDVTLRNIPEQINGVALDNAFLVLSLSDNAGNPFVATITNDRTVLSSIASNGGVETDEWTIEPPTLAPGLVVQSDATGGTLFRNRFKFDTEGSADDSDFTLPDIAYTFTVTDVAATATSNFTINYNSAALVDVNNVLHQIGAEGDDPANRIGAPLSFAFAAPVFEQRRILDPREQDIFEEGTKTVTLTLPQFIHDEFANRAGADRVRITIDSLDPDGSGAQAVVENPGNPTNETTIILGQFTLESMGAVTSRFNGIVGATTFTVDIFVDQATGLLPDYAQFDVTPAASSNGSVLELNASGAVFRNAANNVGDPIVFGSNVGAGEVSVPGRTITVNSISAGRLATLAELMVQGKTVRDLSFLDGDSGSTGHGVVNIKAGPDTQVTVALTLAEAANTTEVTGVTDNPGVALDVTNGDAGEAGNRDDIVVSGFTPGTNLIQIAVTASGTTRTYDIRVHVEGLPVPSLMLRDGNVLATSERTDIAIDGPSTTLTLRVENYEFDIDGNDGDSSPNDAGFLGIVLNVPGADFPANNTFTATGIPTAVGGDFTFGLSADAMTNGIRFYMDPMTDRIGVMVPKALFDEGTGTQSDIGDEDIDLTISATLPDATGGEAAIITPESAEAYARLSATGTTATHEIAGADAITDLTGEFGVEAVVEARSSATVSTATPMIEEAGTTNGTLTVNLNAGAGTKESDGNATLTFTLGSDATYNTDYTLSAACGTGNDVGCSATTAPTINGTTLVVTAGTGGTALGDVVITIDPTPDSTTETNDEDIVFTMTNLVYSPNDRSGVDVFASSAATVTIVEKTPSTLATLTANTIAVDDFDSTAALSSGGQDVWLVSGTTSVTFAHTTAPAATAIVCVLDVQSATTGISTTAKTVQVFVTSGSRVGGGFTTGTVCADARADADPAPTALNDSNTTAYTYNVAAAPATGTGVIGTNPARTLTVTVGDTVDIPVMLADFPERVYVSGTSLEALTELQVRIALEKPDGTDIPFAATTSTNTVSSIAATTAGQNMTITSATNAVVFSNATASPVSFIAHVPTGALTLSDGTWGGTITLTATANSGVTVGAVEYDDGESRIAYGVNTGTPNPLISQAADPFARASGTGDGTLFSFIAANTPQATLSRVDAADQNISQSADDGEGKDYTITVSNIPTGADLVIPYTIVNPDTPGAVGRAQYGDGAIDGSRDYLLRAPDPTDATMDWSRISLTEPADGASGIEGAPLTGTITVASAGLEDVLGEAAGTPLVHGGVINVTIDPTNDGLGDANESVILGLAMTGDSRPTGLEVDNDGDLRTKIVERATVAIAANPSTAVENGADAVVTVTISRGPINDVDANVTFRVDHTPTDDAVSGDYEITRTDAGSFSAAAGTFTIVAGQTTATLNVMAENDGHIDPNESIDIVITSVQFPTADDPSLDDHLTAASLTANPDPAHTVTVRIANDDAEAEITAPASSSILETGETSTTFNVEITSAPDNSATVITLRLTGATYGEANDYTIAPTDPSVVTPFAVAGNGTETATVTGTVTPTDDGLNQGTFSATASFTVTANDDTVMDETDANQDVISILLMNVEESGTNFDITPPATRTIAIVDNDVIAPDFCTDPTGRTNEIRDFILTMANTASGENRSCDSGGTPPTVAELGMIERLDLGGVDVMELKEDDLEHLTITELTLPNNLAAIEPGALDPVLGSLGENGLVSFPPGLKDAVSVVAAPVPGEDNIQQGRAMEIRVTRSNTNMTEPFAAADITYTLTPTGMAEDGDFTVTSRSATARTSGFAANGATVGTLGGVVGNGVDTNGTITRTLNFAANEAAQIVTILAARDTDVPGGVTFEITDAVIPLATQRTVSDEIIERTAGALTRDLRVTLPAATPTLSSDISIGEKSEEEGVITLNLGTGGNDSYGTATVSFSISDPDGSGETETADPRIAKIASLLTTDPPNPTRDEGDYTLVITHSAGIAFNSPPTIDAMGNGSFVLGVGVSSASFAFAAINDDRKEGNEVVTLMITGVIYMPPTGIRAADINFPGTETANVTITEVGGDDIMRETAMIAHAVGQAQVGSAIRLIRQRVSGSISAPRISPQVNPQANAQDYSQAGPGMQLTLAENPQTIQDFFSQMALESSGGMDDGGNYAVWARGQYVNVSGSPDIAGMANFEYDGTIAGVGSGVERRYQNSLVGVSLNYSTADVDSKSDVRAAANYKETMTIVAPYGAWQPQDVNLTLWGTAGYGFGSAEISSTDHTTGSPSVSMFFVQAGADHTASFAGNSSIVVGVSALTVNKTVDAYTIDVGPVPELKTDIFQARADATVYMPVTFGESTVRPYFGLASVHDIGDVLASDRHAVEGRVGVSWLNGPWTVGVEGFNQFLREDEKAWGLFGEVSWVGTSDFDGLFMGMTGGHGTAASMSDVAESTDSVSEIDTTLAAADSEVAEWSFGTNTEYGFAAPLLHQDGRATPYFRTTHSADARLFESGMRLDVTNNIDMTLETNRHIPADEAPYSEHAVGLEARWEF